MQTIEALRQALHEGVVVITFEKSDGTMRQMKATLQANLLPPVDTVSSTPKKPNTEVQPVWDLDAAAWRSFRVDRLKTWTQL